MTPKPHIYPEGQQGLKAGIGGQDRLGPFWGNKTLPWPLHAGRIPRGHLRQTTQPAALSNVCLSIPHVLTMPDFLTRPQRPEPKTHHSRKKHLDIPPQHHT